MTIQQEFERNVKLCELVAKDLDDSCHRALSDACCAQADDYLEKAKAIHWLIGYANAADAFQNNHDALQRAL